MYVTVISVNHKDFDNTYGILDDLNQKDSRTCLELGWIMSTASKTVVAGLAAVVSRVSLTHSAVWSLVISKPSTFATACRRSHSCTTLS